MPIKILALDTSTAACSAALLYGEQITEKFVLAKHRHTELILPMLQELLAENNLVLAQIDAIAFACGPGSFTGLRIAASVTDDIPAEYPQGYMLGRVRKELRMCSPVVCPRCHNVTWAGCGQHVEQALADVPVERRCTCP